MRHRIAKSTILGGLNNVTESHLTLAKDKAVSDNRTFAPFGARLSMMSG